LVFGFENLLSGKLTSFFPLTLTLLLPVTLKAVPPPLPLNGCAEIPARYGRLSRVLRPFLIFDRVTEPRLNSSFPPSPPIFDFSPLHRHVPSDFWKPLPGFHRSLPPLSLSFLFPLKSSPLPPFVGCALVLPLCQTDCVRHREETTLFLKRTLPLPIALPSRFVSSYCRTCPDSFWSRFALKPPSYLHKFLELGSKPLFFSSEPPLVTFPSPSPSRPERSLPLVPARALDPAHSMLPTPLWSK